jgi:hypothetical protein
MVSLKPFFSLPIFPLSSLLSYCCVRVEFSFVQSFLRPWFVYHSIRTVVDLQFVLNIHSFNYSHIHTHMEMNSTYDRDYGLFWVEGRQ